MSTPAKAGTSASPPSTMVKDTPGNIHQTVPTSAGTTAPTIPITATATFGGKVSASVAKVAKVTLTAQGPGEFAGPGVALTIKLTNGSSAAVDLTSVTVTIVGTDQVTAIPVQSGTAAPFTGSVAAGRSATGVYVFSLHSKPTNPVTVTVSYSAAAPVVAFSGSL